MDRLGNARRNTTIIRSNYLLPGNEPFYELSMKLWEVLEKIEAEIVPPCHLEGQGVRLRD